MGNGAVGTRGGARWRIAGVRRVGRLARRLARALRRAVAPAEGRRFEATRPPTGQDGGGPGDIGHLLAAAPTFAVELRAAKQHLAPADLWYPYQSLDNLAHLNRLLTPGHRDLQALADRRPIADIGGADGDLAFLLARQGFTVDVIDWGPTNFNGLRGVRLLADHFATTVSVHEIDLDAQFQLPREDYGLVLLLGILYHLQNPLYILRQLARRSRHMLLSTRIARVTADRSVRLDRAPVAYLVDPAETNNDSTNWWIFSPPGLRRLLDRAGWDVLDQITVGRTRGDSNPAQPDRDERAFCLVRSRGRP